MQADKTLGMFRPPASLNSARIERVTPSMDFSENEESIDRVIRSIRPLFNDSGDENMPRVLAALAHRAPRCAALPTAGPNGFPHTAQLLQRHRADAG